MRMSKHSSCLIYRNFLAGISYSDATPGQSFVYDHLGQLTQITDAAGMRTFACNLYGEPETDSLAANGIAWQVSERYDGLGRQAGYELSADGRRIQQTHLSYDGKGRLSALAAEGMETPFSWTYCEQGGLVEQLAYPNGMTRVNTYEDSRDLLSVIDYQRPGSANPPARHEYDYDALGRPTRRRDTWNTAAPKTTRLFTYNSRGELVGDQLRPGGRFGYQYDNIGNRKEAFEFGSTTDYETDELNRYAGIVRNGGEAFTPQYDADGNQTLVKTSTGIWTVTYNAENRPVKFESEDGGTTVECAYDSMGRRFEKKVTVGGTTGFHARYLYRDYLQVAECDLTGETPVVVRSYLWDPSEPEATRVLAMTRWEANGTQVKEHLYCMHDAMKNVTSLFGEARERRALYEYRPYGGLITSEGNMAEENKFRFSSEYMDDELGLVYYNYRHLNPHDGRWISRDPIMEQGGWNLFAFVNNNSIINFDYLGTIPPPGGFWTGTTGYESLRIPSSTPSNSRKKNLTRVLWKGIKRKVIVVAKTIEKYNITTRLQGALQVMGGGFEATAGSAGLLAPEPTAMSKVIGAILYVHGSDVAQAGLKVLITGEYNSTMTHEAITSAAKAVGVSPQLSENIATGAEIALGAKALSAPVKSCCPTVIVEAENVEVTTVSRWGTELKPNTWVMEGEPTLWNYIWSGKWQPGMGNKFSPPWKVQSYVVPKKSIECPGGKGIDGAIKLLVPAKQRIYKP